MHLAQIAVFFRFFAEVLGGYKVTAFGLWFLFWLPQWGIPHRTCRFYCCLAAHQRTRKKDSAEPSFPILWTPPHPPGVSAAAGHDCCRGGQGYRQLYSGADRLSPLRRGVWVLCVRAEIVRVSVDFAGLEAFVFHYWMEKRRCSGSLVVSFFGLPLTAKWYQFRWMQAHFTNCAGCKNIIKRRSCS